MILPRDKEPKTRARTHRVQQTFRRVIPEMVSKVLIVSTPSRNCSQANTGVPKANTRSFGGPGLSGRSFTDFNELRAPARLA